MNYSWKIENRETPFLNKHKRTNGKKKIFIRSFKECIIGFLNELFDLMILNFRGAFKKMRMSVGLRNGKILRSWKSTYNFCRFQMTMDIRRITLTRKFEIKREKVCSKLQFFILCLKKMAYSFFFFKFDFLYWRKLSYLRDCDFFCYFHSFCRFCSSRFLFFLLYIFFI